MLQGHRINNQIKAPEVRVIDEEGKNIGVLKTEEALKRAYEAGADLIEIAPNADPPVARIISLGKYKYEQERAARKQKAKERKDVTKTIRITFGASLHDMEIRAQQLMEFISEGQKVVVEMRLRGREKAHRDVGYEKIQKFMKLLPVEVKVLQEKKNPNGFLMLITKN